MTTSDAVFAGSIPGLYDRYLGPLLFEPYAETLAERARAFTPHRILETAAGTGIVTEELHRALPEAEIVATDLNPAMLEVAAKRVSSAKVRFQPADALDLPFDDCSFDLVVCQFGVMFYPDKVRGNAEARRILRNGGAYLIAIWDVIERNPASKVAMDAVSRLFAIDPPSFFYRVPHGYSDPSEIECDLRAAGFRDIEVETVAARSRPITASNAAIGICQGTPLRNELEERGPHALERATVVAERALQKLSSEAGLDSCLSAHIVTAIK